MMTDFNSVLTNMKIYLTSCCAGLNIYPVSYVRKDLRTNLTLFMCTMLFRAPRDVDSDEHAQSPVAVLHEKMKLLWCGRKALCSGEQSVAKHVQAAIAPRAIRSLLKYFVFSQHYRSVLLPPSVTSLRLNSNVVWGGHARVGELHHRQHFGAESGSKI